jgi:hypothetical protein
MNWITDFFSTVFSTIGDLLPIMAILIGFQLFVLRKPLPNARRVIIGFVCVLLGLSLFLVGLEHALFPLGRLMAEQLTSADYLHSSGAHADGLTNWYDYRMLLLFAFTMGFATTLAEPALIAVALKASQISAGAISPLGLRIAVAIGVGTGITLGVLRIIIDVPIHWFIITGYALILLQTSRAPRTIIPLAYDSGGVATSTVTVPIIAALGLGLAEALPGRDPLLDGFGLIAMACMFPIMTVIGYAQLARAKNTRAMRQNKPDQVS